MISAHRPFRPITSSRILRSNSTPGYINLGQEQGRSYLLTPAATKTKLDARPFTIPFPRNHPYVCKSSHSRHKSLGCVPRPRNAFIVFRSEYVAMFEQPLQDSEDKKEYSKKKGGKKENKHQQQLSKQAGVVWNIMTTEDQAPYRKLAALEKIDHQQMDAGYVQEDNHQGQGKGGKGLSTET